MGCHDKSEGEEHTVEYGRGDIRSRWSGGCRLWDRDGIWAGGWRIPCRCGGDGRHVMIGWGGGSVERGQGETIEAGKAYVEDVLKYGYIPISDRA